MNIIFSIILFMNDLLKKFSKSKIKFLTSFSLMNNISYILFIFWIKSERRGTKIYNITIRLAPLLSKEYQLSEDLSYNFYQL